MIGVATAQEPIATFSSRSPTHLDDATEVPIDPSLLIQRNVQRLDNPIDGPLTRSAQKYLWTVSRGRTVPGRFRH